MACTLKAENTYKRRRIDQGIFFILFLGRRMHSLSWSSLFYEFLTPSTPSTMAYSYKSLVHYAATLLKVPFKYLFNCKTLPIQDQLTNSGSTANSTSEYRTQRIDIWITNGYVSLLPAKSFCTLFFKKNYWNIYIIILLVDKNEGLLLKQRRVRNSYTAHWLVRSKKGYLMSKEQKF